MTLRISAEQLRLVEAHGEQSYPHEGAGLLLGLAANGSKEVRVVRPLSNEREESARHNRYLITPEQYIQGEAEAARLGLDVIGIFHSHPDHPPRPSEFDREWAWPQYSYIITSVEKGRATASRSWELKDDRSGFVEEDIMIRDA